MHDENTSPDDTQASDHELERQVKHIMGPPPQAEQPGGDQQVAPDGSTAADRVVIMPHTSKDRVEHTQVITPDSAQPKPAHDDPLTNQAVDDIVAQEGDTVLAAEDAAQTPPVTKTGFKQKIRELIQTWWQNKRLRWATLAGLVVVLLGLIILPPSRYFLLNSFGVRSSASITVVDNATQLPLKSVAVSAGGATAQTDINGKVSLTHVKLGRTKLVVTKQAFAISTQSVTIGFGGNHLPTVGLHATGSQYIIEVKDYLSGKPIAKAEASSGTANALSDSSGKITLTVEPKDNQTSFSVSVTATAYRIETFTLATSNSTAKTVTMVPSRKEVYISNKSGKDDLYTSDIDGQHEKLILAGTGSEQNNLVLVPHPTDEEVAYVSTRENVHDADGFLLSTLMAINLTTSTSIKVAQSEQIQIVGWVGERLIYVQIAAGASASNPKRYRMVSYDYKTGDKTELASANSFNDVLLIGSSVYYAPSSLLASDPTTGFIKISADGQTKSTLLTHETFNIFRTSYSTLTLSVGQDWYQYLLGDTLPTKLSSSPVNPSSRLYVDSPDGTHSVWVDQRDGKGVLVIYDTAKKTEATRLSQQGVVYPVRWLTSSIIVYRVRDQQETADYAMSLNGGNAHKIRDVTSTAGLSLWYYY